MHLVIATSVHGFLFYFDWYILTFKFSQLWPMVTSWFAKPPSLIEYFLIFSHKITQPHLVLKPTSSHFSKELQCLLVEDGI